MNMIKKCVCLLVLVLFGKIVVGQKVIKLICCNGVPVTLSDPCTYEGLSCDVGKDADWKNITTGVELKQEKGKSEITYIPTQDVVIERKSKKCNPEITRFEITVITVDNIIFKEKIGNEWDWGIDEWYNFGTNRHLSAIGTQDTFIKYISIENEKSDEFSVDIVLNPIQPTPDCINIDADYYTDKLSITPKFASSNTFNFNITSHHSFLEYKPAEVQLWAYCNTKNKKTKEKKARTKKTYSKINVIAFKEPEINVVFVRVNQKDTGVGIHNFNCPNLSADYNSIVSRMNTDYFKDPIIKFKYDSEIVIDVNYDLDKNGGIKRDGNFTSEEEIILWNGLTNNVNFVNIDTFKTIFIFMVNNIPGVEGYGVGFLNEVNRRGSKLVLNANLINSNKVIYPLLYVEYWAMTIAHEIGHVLKLHHANTFNAITNTYGSSQCGAIGGIQNYDDNHNVMDYCPYSTWSNLNSSAPNVVPPEKITFKHFQWKIMHQSIFNHFKKSYQ